MKIKPIHIFLLLCLSFLIYSFSIYMAPMTALKVRRFEKGKALKGQLVWQGNNCQSCHQLYGLGGYLGPDLTNVYSGHGKGEGTAMTVDFKLNGMNFLALNGGPKFKFNEAVSIVIYCDTQDEIDHYWTKLTENGEEGPCGWLKDKYGVSWQITPSVLPKYLSDQNLEKRNRVERCAFGMKKFDIETLQKAYEGK